MGPPIGGYLAEPVANIPILFGSDSVWEKYPFLLPNVVVASVLLFCAAIGFVYLEETHPYRQGRSHTIHYLLVRIGQWCKWPYHRSHTRYQSIATSSNSSQATSTLSEDENDNVSAGPVLDYRKAFTPLVCVQIFSYALLGYLKVCIMASQAVYLGLPPEQDESHRSVLHMIFGTSGGLGLSSTVIANVLLSQAVASILSQWFIVTPFITRYTALTAYRVVLIVFMIIYALCPVAAAMSSLWNLAFIVPIWWAYGIFDTMGSTAQSIMYVILPVQLRRCDLPPDLSIFFLLNLRK